MTTATLKLGWLEKLVAQFPEKERLRKNMIEIAGYPRRESVNSNFLAFYLNEKEDHRMERLFLESLLEVVGEQAAIGSLPDFELFSTTFTVERERDFIDILLQAETQEGEPCPWALIIENKIDHQLRNDLGRYWQSVEADHKIGIVLSLHPEFTEADLSFELAGVKHSFVNVTHADLIQAVLQRLPEFFERADDRHLLFLKEYFNYIENLYDTPEADKEMEQKLREIQKYKKEIDQLNYELVELQKYVQERLKLVFAQFGFEPKNEFLAKAKTYYSLEAEQRKQGVGSLRFWVNVEKLLKENSLSIYLELCGEGVSRGPVIRTTLLDKGFPGESELVIGSGKGQAYFHLASLNTSLPEGALDAALEEKIGLFFGKGAGHDLVEIAFQQL